MTLWSSVRTGRHNLMINRSVSHKLVYASSSLFDHLLRDKSIDPETTKHVMAVAIAPCPRPAGGRLG
jgi:hypothetical protein